MTKIQGKPEHIGKLLPGIHPETATMEQVAKGLRLVFRFQEYELLDVVKSTPTRDGVQLSIALPDNTEAVQRLQQVLKDAKFETRHGVREKGMAHPSLHRAHVGSVNTLEVSVPVSRRDGMAQRLARFVNEEAALNSPEMLAKLTDMMERPEHYRG